MRTYCTLPSSVSNLINASAAALLQWTSRGLLWQVLHMIMGLERLDRITAFTEEQSGPLSPVEFPPPRAAGASAGASSTIREEEPEQSGTSERGGAGEEAGAFGRGPAWEQQSGAEGDAALAGRSRDDAGRERVAAAVAAAAGAGRGSSQEQLSSKSASLPPPGATGQRGGAGGQGRVRSLALAWEQARSVLQERAASGHSAQSVHTSPETSPRDQAVPEGAQERLRRISHARSRSSDSAYDLQQHGDGPGKGRGGAGPLPPLPADTQQLQNQQAGQLAVTPRSHSEAFASPRGDSQGGAAAAESSPEQYQRYPPVSSAGLAKLQVGCQAIDESNVRRTLYPQHDMLDLM